MQFHINNQEFEKNMYITINLTILKGSISFNNFKNIPLCPSTEGYQHFRYILHFILRVMYQLTK